MHEGFVDLRHGGGSDEGTSGGNESFWPSFTDIMMVVMMIFMIASTVLVIRNWELVAELRNTMEAQQRAMEAEQRAVEAEQRAAALARSASEENATLEEQLAQAQHQLSLQRMQLMRASEERQQIEQELELKAREVDGFRADLQRSQQRSGSLDERVAALSTQLREERDAQARMRNELADQANRLNMLSDERSALQATNTRQAEQIAALEASRERSQTELSAIENDYSQLQEKYNKLVRPARSAAGKRVVEVRYEKVAGLERFQIKEPGESVYHELNRSELEARLGELKESEQTPLYVKIIIPEQSGLSYNEAWRFTSETLNRYDYYYTE